MTELNATSEQTLILPKVDTTRQHTVTLLEVDNIRQPVLSLVEVDFTRQQVLPLVEFHVLCQHARILTKEDAASKQGNGMFDGSAGFPEANDFRDRRAGNQFHLTTQESLVAYHSRRAGVRGTHHSAEGQACCNGNGVQPNRFFHKSPLVGVWERADFTTRQLVTLRFRLT